MRLLLRSAGDDKAKARRCTKPGCRRTSYTHTSYPSENQDLTRFQSPPRNPIPIILAFAAMQVDLHILTIVATGQGKNGEQVGSRHEEQTTPSDLGTDSSSSTQLEKQPRLATVSPNETMHAR